mmetsp:Transcript_11821/g.35871  ORF Transcript_11821/g.35871 Transcript_11821/m.35871 type:complete len:233 (-) Transcript_11821:341-1039(-)
MPSQPEASSSSSMVSTSQSMEAVSSQLRMGHGMLVTPSLMRDWSQPLRHCRQNRWPGLRQFESRARSATSTLLKQISQLKVGRVGSGPMMPRPSRPCPMDCARLSTGESSIFLALLMDALRRGSGTTSRSGASIGDASTRWIFCCEMSTPKMPEAERRRFAVGDTKIMASSSSASKPISGSAGSDSRALRARAWIASCFPHALALALLSGVRELARGLRMRMAGCSIAPRVL